MSASPELTPKEKFHASLYKDPSALLRMLFGIVTLTRPEHISKVFEAMLVTL